MIGSDWFFYIGGETMNKTVIEVKQLKKAYGDVKVLDGVSFQVKEGEIFALLGCNGAGKTTLIKILSTLAKADGGQALVCGYDVKQQAMQVKEHISLTGQFSAVDEILSGKENLMLIAKLRHLHNPETVVDELLHQFQLTHSKDRRAATYSGGMKRRLDIAMSLMGNPQVVFLDEPTTGLDPEARLDVWQKVKQLAGNKVTVVLTTQYLEEAEQLADKIAILHEGNIIMNGTLQELKQQFPPVKVEYVEKQPSLEDIFLSVINKKEDKKDETSK